jgi:hypothetical protein
MLGRLHSNASRIGIPLLLGNVGAGILGRMTIETPITLPEDVEAALAERGPALGGRQLVLLPRETRDGRTYFLEDDIEALALAREVGLDAAFLFDGEDRRFLHENTAGWELAAAVAISEDLGATGIAALIRYLFQRVRHAKKEGLYRGEESTAPLKLTITQVRQDGASGDTSTQTVKIEGDLVSVTSVVERLLGRADG